jgi:hypothetical protein
VDLRGYSRQIDQELREVEVESVRDYVEQSAEIVSLHNQMQTCDNTLAKMQEMLLGFQVRAGRVWLVTRAPIPNDLQADLSGISAEIKHLQDESLQMNIKLRNRRATEAGLRMFLNRVVLPPALVSSICHNEVCSRAPRVRVSCIIR